MSLIGQNKLFDISNNPFFPQKDIIDTPLFKSFQANKLIRHLNSIQRRNRYKQRAKELLNKKLKLSSIISKLDDKDAKLYESIKDKENINKKDLLQHNKLISIKDYYNRLYIDTQDRLNNLKALYLKAQAKIEEQVNEINALKLQIKKLQNEKSPVNKFIPSNKVNEEKIKVLEEKIKFLIQNVKGQKTAYDELVKSNETYNKRQKEILEKQRQAYNELNKKHKEFIQKVNNTKGTAEQKTEAIKQGFERYREKINEIERQYKLELSGNEVRTERLYKTIVDGIRNKISALEKSTVETKNLQINSLLLKLQYLNDLRSDKVFDKYNELYKETNRKIARRDLIKENNATKKRLANEIQRNNVQLKNLEDEIDKYKLRKSKIDVLLIKEKESKIKIVKLENIINNLKKSTNLAFKNVERLETNIATSNETIRKYKNEIEKLKNTENEKQSTQLKNLIKEKQTDLETITKLKKAKNLLHQENVNLHDKLKEYTTQLKDEKLSKGALEKTNKDLETRIKIVNNRNIKVTDEYDNLIKRYRLDANRIKNDLAAAKLIIEKEKEEKKELTDTIKRIELKLQIYLDRIKKLTIERDDNEQQINRLNRNIDEITKKLKLVEGQFQSQITQEAKPEDLANLNKIIEQHRENEKHRTLRSTVPFKEGDTYQELEKKYKELEQTNNTLRKAHQALIRNNLSFSNIVDLFDYKFRSANEKNINKIISNMNLKLTLDAILLYIQNEKFRDLNIIKSDEMKERLKYAYRSSALVKRLISNFNNYIKKIFIDNFDDDIELNDQKNNIVNQIIKNFENTKYENQAKAYRTLYDRFVVTQKNKRDNINVGIDNTRLIKAFNDLFNSLKEKVRERALENEDFSNRYEDIVSTDPDGIFKTAHESETYLPSHIKNRIRKSNIVINEITQLQDDVNQKFKLIMQYILGEYNAAITMRNYIAQSVKRSTELKSPNLINYIGPLHARSPESIREQQVDMTRESKVNPTIATQSSEYKIIIQLLTYRTLQFNNDTSLDLYNYPLHPSLITLFNPTSEEIITSLYYPEYRISNNLIKRLLFTTSNTYQKLYIETDKYQYNLLREISIFLVFTYISTIVFNNMDKQKGSHGLIDHLYKELNIRSSAKFNRPNTEALQDYKEVKDKFNTQINIINNHIKSSVNYLNNIINIINSNKSLFEKQTNLKDYDAAKIYGNSLKLFSYFNIITLNTIVHTILYTSYIKKENDSSKFFSKMIEQISKINEKRKILLFRKIILMINKKNKEIRDSSPRNKIYGRNTRFDVILDEIKKINTPNITNRTTDNMNTVN